jgi:hypothetical protein
MTSDIAKNSWREAIVAMISMLRSELFDTCYTTLNNPLQNGFYMKRIITTAFIAFALLASPAMAQMGKDHHGNEQQRHEGNKDQRHDRKNHRNDHRGHRHDHKERRHDEHRG